MTDITKLKKCDFLLEAEVTAGQQKKFQKRYEAATGITVTPGNPQHYQNQPDKWGAELRVYFNDPCLSTILQALGIHVEYPRKGYKAGKYKFRFNDNKLWWKLVEDYGMRLGVN
jgi:hypothetical protein